MPKITGDMKVCVLANPADISGTITIPAPVPSEEISGYITVAEPDTYYI